MSSKHRFFTETVNQVAVLRLGHISSSSKSLVVRSELLRVLKKGSNPQEEKSDPQEEKKNPQEEKMNLQEEKNEPTA